MISSSKVNIHVLDDFKPLAVAVRGEDCRHNAR
jgi:hypothetical protein